MSDQSPPHTELVGVDDELYQFAQQIELYLRAENFAQAAILMETYVGTSWYALKPDRRTEILQQILAHLDSQPPILKGLMGILTASSPGQFDDHSYLATLDMHDPYEMFMLSLFRMTDLRLHGRPVEAMEQAENLEAHLGKMRLLLDVQDGWELFTILQIGLSAMLAGDFTRALTAFTRAQMLPLVPKFAFLTREALVESAVIHACFGNSTTARSLLQRSEKIPRTSSWVEINIDTHRDFAAILTSGATPEEALDQLETLSLHDIGELWPFYIVAIHRLLEAGGYHDELDHRLEMLDTLPFPAIDCEGFSGSIIPLNRAMLSMKASRDGETQKFLDRADPRLSYTRLLVAAGHIYAGRTQQALQLANRLRCDTRGFRLLEIRRLSILAAAQYQSDTLVDCIATLTVAAEIPRGLDPTEIQLFSPETRELASQHVTAWPRDPGGPSAFLTGLPKPGHALTEREVEIIGHLAQGHRRADIADHLFISVNTLKTQLRSIYRKLEVSTAADAVVGAQRRGPI